MTDAFIYDAIRSPRGKGRPDGALHEVTSVTLSARMLDAMATRNGLHGHAVEDVIWGNVTQVGEQGGCLARSAVLASTLDQSILSKAFRGDLVPQNPNDEPASVLLARFRAERAAADAGGNGKRPGGRSRSAAAGRRAVDTAE